jgi:hypothetical protein
LPHAHQRLLGRLPTLALQRTVFQLLDVGLLGVDVVEQKPVFLKCD